MSGNLSPRVVRFMAWVLVMCLGVSLVRADEDSWLTYKGRFGPGKGKRIVFVTGDEEYRSEESMPAMARILAERHGFHCTVLFSVNRETGEVDPSVDDNIPGLEALKEADLMIVFTRFRHLPETQMKSFVDYVNSGRPVMGIRTATHSFDYDRFQKEPYAEWAWRGPHPQFAGGFGRQVLGETWINHHGNHGSQATLGLIAKDGEKHPVLKGIKDGDIFGPTDVYGVRLPLPGDSMPLVMGQVLTGMKKDSPPLAGKKNDPMMPVAWVKSYKAGDKTGRVFTTTMGASQDLLSEGLRRLLVNATYWSLGLEDKIDANSKVDIVGKFEPKPFRNDGYAKNVKPADLLKD